MRYLRTLVITMGAALAAGPLVADSPKDVNVVNTPTVDARQSGEWNVSIDATREPF